MFFDARLWQFTYGARLRIAATVVMGVFASLVGIGTARAARVAARTGIRGGHVSPSWSCPFVLVAVVMVLRGWLEHTRAMIAHHTSVRIQLELRKRLYAQGGRARPRPLRARAHRRRCMLSMVDGVEQLETYFGEYLPQLLRRRHHASIIVFVLLAFLDFPVCRAAVRLRDVHPASRRRSFHRWDVRSSMRRSLAYRELRGGVPRRYTGSRHPQGVRSEHGAWQAAGCARTRGVSGARCGCSRPTR